MRLSWYWEWEKKVEKVTEAARKGRLDDINSCLEGLPTCEIFSILQRHYHTKTTPLTEAIKEGQTEVVRLLVEKYKVAVNGGTSPGKAPLLHTGEDCPLEITKILVENGADVNFVDRISKATALTRACKFNRLDLVQYLVEKGANINEVVDGTTALVIATRLKSFDIVSYLVSKGAAVNQVVKGGTALYFACRNGCLDAVRCLVECGADVNLAVGDEPKTPLHFACQAKSLDIARCLVEHGANVNATDSVGCSPLGICCKNGSTDIMRFLLENGADPNLPDHNGRTPLLHAAMERQMHAVDCYIEMATISQQAKIDGLELLGASLIFKEQTELGHEYLCRGMKERYRNPVHTAEKVLLPPVPAYGDFRESQTLEELEQRRRESTLLTKEALLIWERVLGRGAKEVKQIFTNFAPAQNHIPPAWFLHVLKTSSSFLTMRDIEGLISVTLRRKPLAFSILEETLTLTFQALSSHNGDKSCKDDIPSPSSSVYAQGILIFQEALSVAETKEEKQRLEGLLKNFLQLTMTGPNGFSALHVALDGKFQNEFRWIEQLRLSPDFIGLLLQCKADPIYAQDEDGNTPLHFLFSRPYDSEELPVAQTVAGMLLKADAHLDARNRRSQTPLKCQHADRFQEILKDYTSIPLSLQCWCAMVILNEKVPFHSQPEKTKKFLKLHGSETLDT